METISLKDRFLKKQGVEGGGGWERPMDEKVDVEKLESGKPPSSSHLNIYNSSNINVNIDWIDPINSVSRFNCRSDLMDMNGRKGGKS